MKKNMIIACSLSLYNLLQWSVYNYKDHLETSKTIGRLVERGLFVQINKLVIYHFVSK